MELWTLQHEWGISDPKKLDVERVWRDVIKKGKESRKLKALAKKRKKRGEKYNPEEMGATGAISLEDAFCLYGMIKCLKVRTVLEVGTWFGTSASVMTQAGVKVTTCDKNNMYVLNDPRITYFNMESTKLFKRLIDGGAKFDMVFMDGRLFPGDERLVMKLLRRPIFVTHDFEPGKKGERNIQAMKKVFPKHYGHQFGIIASLIGESECTKETKQ